MCRGVPFMYGRIIAKNRNNVEAHCHFIIQGRYLEGASWQSIFKMSLLENRGVGVTLISIRQVHAILMTQEQQKSSPSY